jgi:hypothetical protein
MEISKNKDERIGQTIWNAMNQAEKWETPEANALFFIDDDELLDILKKYSLNNL